MLKGRRVKNDTRRECSIIVCGRPVGLGGLEFEEIGEFWCKDCAARYGAEFAAIYDDDGQLTVSTKEGVRPFEPTDDEV